jgi:hypothetical protein
MYIRSSGAVTPEARRAVKRNGDPGHYRGMTRETCWTFVVDDHGHAQASDAAVGVVTVAPGEYLVTLPMALTRRRARVRDDAGFIAATPGDDAGNTPNTLRVLTMTPEQAYGPRPFTLVVTAA